MRGSLLLLLCATIYVSADICPFKRLNNKAKRGITLAAVPPTLQRARNIGAQVACFPPLCTPGAAHPARQLLSKAELKANGFPELYSTTVNSIKTDFCAVLNGGCNTDTDGEVSNGVPTDYSEDLDRADVIAGAIQLAFHDAGTYDPDNSTYPGGPDACACDKKLENEGLDYIKGVLEPIYEKYEDYLSLADFWALAANTAIEVSVSRTTDTSALDFQYGRTDDSDCANCLESVANRLPDSALSTDHVTEVFIDRMGFTNEETVALMGAHSLGRMDFNNSGYEGVWDQTFSKLDGRYYIAILSFPWCRYVVDETGGAWEDVESPKHEWRVPAEMAEAADYYSVDTPKLLNTDMCLAWAIGDGDDVNSQTCPTKCMSGDDWDDCTSPVESGDTTKSCESTVSPDSPSGTLTVCDKQTNGMRTYVEKFASDSDTFYTSFFPAFKKLMELGETDLASPTEVTEPSDLAYDVDCNTAACVECVGTAISTMTPSASGSAVTGYSVDTAFPAGISMDTTTGSISGTPTEDVSTTTYTVTATNDAGSDTYKVKFRVNAADSNQCSSLIQKTAEAWSEIGSDQWNERA